MRLAPFELLTVRVRDVRQNQSYSEAIQGHFCASCFIRVAADGDKQQISIINPAIRAASRLKNRIRNHRLFNEDVFLDEDSGHLTSAGSEAGTVAVLCLVSCYLSLAKLIRLAPYWRSCL